MVFVTPQKEIDAYFASPALSQSYIKPLTSGLENFLTKAKQYQEEEENEDGVDKEHLLIGSAVDCILTGEEGRFDDIYYISDLSKRPSDTEMTIINRVFNTCLVAYQDQEIPLLADLKEIIQEALDFNEYQMRWKPETRLEKAIAFGTEYFESLKLAIGKKVLAADQYQTVMGIVNSLRENPRTGKYFDRNSLSLEKNIDVYYQLPIFFKYKGKDCKALLDILLVFKDDEGNILHVQPIDLKTTGNHTIYFPSSIKSFRYDIQAAFYTEALKSKFPGAEIKPFRFIAESSIVQGKPLVFELSESLLHIGKYGRSAINLTDTNGLFMENDDVYQPIKVVKEIKGFDNCIDDYIYYEKQGWVEDKRVSEKDGLLVVGWEGIL